MVLSERGAEPSGLDPWRSLHKTSLPCGQSQFQCAWRVSSVLWSWGFLAVGMHLGNGT